MYKRSFNHGLKLLTVVMLGITSMTAKADFIGIYADANALYSEDSNTQSHNSDHGVNGFYSLAIEHPVPLLPNLKLRYGNIKDVEAEERSGSNTAANASVETLDAIAYYELLDNIISVDAGLGIKRVNTDTTSQNLIQNVKKSYDDTIPAAYVSAGGKLPFTGFSAKAEVLAGKSTNADFSDYNAEVKYNFVETIAVDLGVKLGYRETTINFDKDANKTLKQVKVSGPYVGLEAHF